jgi:eukaryotic-like serine/threonine-protein kinase
MAIVDPLVLQGDVLLIPVTELPVETQRQLSWQEGDYAITRPGSRTPSRIIDAASVALLGHFKQPRTVAAAVIAYSRERNESPEATLLEAYPLLDSLMRSGFLVAEGSTEEQRLRPSLPAGAEVGGFTVGDCVQLLEDTEIYQVSSPGRQIACAALKIMRPGLAAASHIVAGLQREAAILGHLSAAVAKPAQVMEPPISPCLLAADEWEERAYLVVEWCSGVDAITAAGELRRSGSKQARRRLLGLCRTIADAYGRLHDTNVVHADVHPRNVLVGAGGGVRLIDFGLARWDGLPAELEQVGRGGIGFFMEPELATAALAGRSAPATAAGEQYAVAALLYLLWCGAHYLDFSLEREEMLRQIAHDPPAPFASRGLDPWPELEAVLCRGLAKDPAHRFASCGELSAALVLLAAATPQDLPANRAPRSAALRAGERLLAQVLAQVQPENGLWREGLPAPRASLNYGGAGIAYALYRIALAREDASLLAQADLWAARAARDGGDEAFYNSRFDITAEIVGRVSPYHTASGPRCVQAMIANARGDAAAAHRSVVEFAAMAAADCANPDLTLGRSGLLVASALLFDVVGDAAPDEVTGPLRKVGEALLRGLWQDLDRLLPISQCESWRNLGLAHGWAGYLFGTLQWCRATGRPLPGGLTSRLDQLAASGSLWQRGRRWQWYVGERTDEGPRPAGSMPGWCNGSAGIAQLFALAYRLLRDPAYVEACAEAAWNAWEAPDKGGSLCCGLAGRAYSLLSLYRLLHADGDPAAEDWLERARQQAEDAAAEIAEVSEAADSLYKGRVGVAVLVADLARPEASAMPFCEDEGWGADRA